jgi:hypothetical protein
VDAEKEEYGDERESVGCWCGRGAGVSVVSIISLTLSIVVLFKPLAFGDICGCFALCSRHGAHSYSL